MFTKSLKAPSKDQALPGREARMPVPAAHFVNGHPLQPPFPDGLASRDVRDGLFLGRRAKVLAASRGVHHGGRLRGRAHPESDLPEVCSGMTGHAEVVLVVFDPHVIRYEDLLKAFWEDHDPTQGMRQGNDIGTQYRSGIYCDSDADRRAAEASRDAYQQRLSAAGYGRITTEILPAPEFYYAEDYHQQYLAKNPDGYCGLGGTGVSCPVGLGAHA